MNYVTLYWRHLYRTTVICPQSYWLRAGTDITNTQAMPQGPWDQCWCSILQSSAVTTDGTRVTAFQWCKWTLTHNLTHIFLPFLTAVAIVSAVMCVEIYILHDLPAFDMYRCVAIFDNSADCWLRCDWLLQHHMSVEVGLVPASPHALPVAVPQQSNVCCVAWLWPGTRGSSTKSLLLPHGVWNVCGRYYQVGNPWWVHQ